jgi:serine/threonine protein phosphatase PrpC
MAEQINNPAGIARAVRLTCAFLVNNFLLDFTPSMKVKCFQVSSIGAVRDHNEDFVVFWEPPDFDERQKVGSIAILADGVGGMGNGDVASRTAAETAIDIFREAKPGTSPADIFREIYNTASAKIFQAAREKGRMATTMLTSIFRDNAVNIAHVGDSRAYLIRGGKIRRLTSDHSYTSLQVKLCLLLERNAMTSPHRSTLTRALGFDAFCRYDVLTEMLQPNDLVFQCSDGLYGFVLDEEILDIINKFHPGQACKNLIALAEKRQASDNVSLQLIQVWDVHYPQGLPDPAKVPKTAGSDVSVGTLLDDRFEITDVIAKSGMGSLFRATDRQTGKAVALKIPHLQIESDPAGYERFRREEEIGIRLNHPYILKIIPVEKKSRPYIAMEYLEGQTLADLLGRVHPLPEPDAARIASRICEALDYMHNHQVVHRDLKPPNIMLCNDGSIRIMDFGIAKSLASRRLTFVGFTPTMGTPDYMAPEQVKGSRGDHRTDIYSLGAILYEMTTGEVPFGGDSPYVIMNSRVTGDPVAPRKINPKLTPVIEEIILHAMEREPKRRYQSAAEMKRELDDYEIVELSKRFERLRSPPVWKSRFRMVPIIIVFVLLWILGFFAMFLYFKKHH